MRLLSPEILDNVLRQGSEITLKKDSYLIREGDNAPPEMYILVEGSLVVVASNKFILRLDQPGDVVGEIAVIQSAARSADVVAEVDCRLIAFPAKLFEVDPHSTQASILYVLFSHVMAAKLRITTAQALIHKNLRVAARGNIRVAIVDANSADRAMVRSVISHCWDEATVLVFDDPAQIVDNNENQRFDLIIADIHSTAVTRREGSWPAALIKEMQLRGAHIVVLSDACHNPDDRETLIKMGVDDLMIKPCTHSDLNHVITRVKSWYYKNLELDRAETEAETDRLTGLANRRRLDQFLDALVTVHSQDSKPFSMIMMDIDNFKQYNDTNGHQMGDAVLKSVAALIVDKVRRSDLAARFGGEEFVLVLPDCGKSRAMELAETLRETIETATVPFQERQPVSNVTVTMGVATFPDDSADLDTLLKIADDCLYEGKRKGKNIVVAAPV